MWISGVLLESIPVGRRPGHDEEPAGPEGVGPGRPPSGGYGFAIRSPGGPLHGRLPLRGLRGPRPPRVAVVRRRAEPGGPTTPSRRVRRTGGQVLATTTLRAGDASDPNDEFVAGCYDPRSVLGHGSATVHDIRQMMGGHEGSSARSVAPSLICYSEQGGWTDDGVNCGPPGCVPGISYPCGGGSAARVATLGMGPDWVPGVRRGTRNSRPGSTDRRADVTGSRVDCL